MNTYHPELVEALSPQSQRLGQAQPERGRIDRYLPQRTTKPDNLTRVILETKVALHA